MPDDDDQTTTPAPASKAESKKDAPKAKAKPPKERRMSLREYAVDSDLDPVRERALTVRTETRDRFTRSGWDQKLSQAMKQEV